MAKRTKRKSMKGVRHNRDRVETMSMKAKRVKTVSVRVQIERNTAAVGASGGFKNLFVAFACPVGKHGRIPMSPLATRRQTVHKFDGHCAEGYGSSPTAAFNASLKSLASKKR